MPKWYVSLNHREKKHPSYPKHRCDPVVRETLLSLHPQEAPVLVGGGPGALPAPGSLGGPSPEGWNWLEGVQEAVRSFAPGCAPGPSGLRPLHLKEVFLKQGPEGSLAQALVALCQAAAAGSLPPALAPWLGCSTVVPLAKKGGGTRPIAVGDTIRRVVGKTLLQHPDVRGQVAALRPRQVGVRVPFGAELVGMGVQAAVRSLGAASDWVCFQADVTNAFNSVSRAAVLRSTLTRAPALYNWLAFTYANPVPLLCQGSFLCPSARGVHQGDAMGPVAFALGLHEALERVAGPASRLTWECWYLDDGTIFGPLADVCHYIRALHGELRTVGLELNSNKSLLWGPGCPVDVSDNNCPLRSLPLDHVARSLSVLPFKPGAGVTSLGVPCDVPGSLVHTDSVWSSVTGKCLQALQTLDGLPDLQLQFVLLRSCLDGCKVTHLLRQTPLDSGQAWSGRGSFGCHPEPSDRACGHPAAAQPVDTGLFASVVGGSRGVRSNR